MKVSTDPSLLFIAKSALDISFSEPPTEVRHAHAIWTAGGAKLPKHVKQIPTGEKRFVVGVSLAGKYRPLAYMATSLDAARLADCVIVRLDEFRKQGVRDNLKVQESMLNFPIEHAQRELIENESLGAWWSEVISHLLTEKILTESEEPAAFIRTGRPHAADSAAKLRERLDNIEHKLDTILFHIVTHPTTIIVGPSTPGTPAQPVIDWTPSFTCGSNNALTNQAVSDSINAVNNDSTK